MTGKKDTRLIGAMQISKNAVLLLEANPHPSGMSLKIQFRRRHQEDGLEIWRDGYCSVIPAERLPDLQSLIARATELICSDIKSKGFKRKNKNLP